MYQVFHVTLTLKVELKEGERKWSEKRVADNLKKNAKPFGEVVSYSVVEREAK